MFQIIILNIKLNHILKFKIEFDWSLNKNGNLIILLINITCKI